MTTLGVIGGSGIYDIAGLTRIEELRVSTPFGDPSDALIRGRLGDTTLLFLPRHGRGHLVAPTAINYRANICALKLAGAEQVISLSAVGSMREDIHPGDVVIVDQYIDCTKQRISTFFDTGVVAHVGFSHPVCPNLSAALARAARRAGGQVISGGTYVCIEGPQFSSKAESLLYRSWGVSVIGMTALPEAKLAREAELPYATLALATDYDCWHESAEPVSVEAILRVLHENAELAKRTVAELVRDLPKAEESPAAHALEHAIITTPAAITSEARARLDWLIGPHLQKQQQA
ncbi:MAG TPA: S-methyl-5'-thioadenosine phosphorylase [Polyangiaceae bacterium]|nr:S-methyl-5'-thioadenosine phosphorylase [Polyangiaceae bacterium]